MKKLNAIKVGFMTEEYKIDEAQQSQLGRLATNIRTKNGTTIVRLYNTDVVAFNDKEIILNNGGYKTNTTKTRMNQASNQFGLGYVIFQEDYDWFVHYNNKTIPFENGMILKRI